MNIKKYIKGAILLSYGSLAPAWAAEIPPQSTFEIRTAPPPAQKNHAIRTFFMEQGINDLFRGFLARLDYHGLYQINENPNTGVVLDAYWQYLIGRSPATLEQFVPQSTNSHFMELSAGAGYRIPIQHFALIPQIHFRDLFAFGNTVNQHLFGFEPGVRLEYWIYPEVTKISLDYGFTVPFAHVVNQSGSVSPFTLTLNRLYLEMSYRLLPWLDLATGFQFWQVPSELGSGTIKQPAISNITGFQIGLGWVF